MNNDMFEKMPFKSYFEVNQKREVRPFVIRSMESCATFQNALELGAGNLHEAKYLATRFKKVMAVDNSSQSQEFYNELQSAEPTENLNFSMKNFNQLEFEENSFDYILSLEALPYFGEKDFENFFKKIATWLMPGGVFCCNLYGDRHVWNKGHGDIKFFSKEELESLLSSCNLEIDFLLEKEKTGVVENPQALVHTFGVIVKKK